MNNHNLFDAANWETGDGSEVPNFTVITAEDIRSGRVKVKPGAKLTTEQVLTYLERLKHDHRDQIAAHP